MAQLHAAVSSVCHASPCCIAKVTPYSTPSPAVLHGFGQACKWQMDSGCPGRPLSPCLIHEQRSGRCPSSHTIRDTLSALCTRASHHISPPNLFPVTFSLLCAAVLLFSLVRKVIIVIARCNGKKHSAKNVIRCILQLAASHCSSISHSFCMNIIM